MKCQLCKKNIIVGSELYSQIKDDWDLKLLNINIAHEMCKLIEIDNKYMDNDFLFLLAVRFAETISIRKLNSNPLLNIDRKIYINVRENSKEELDLKINWILENLTKEIKQLINISKSMNTYTIALIKLFQFRIEKNDETIYSDEIMKLNEKLDILTRNIEDILLLCYENIK